jgi:2-succinyl-5-enolpyruvyl-6-hydroxy-3-cyclohexene-1-carboxylate synthase
VCTADRPPELHDVGAPQTIDQTRLYGPAVRWFHDPGVPDDAAAPSWRSLASRALAATWGDPPGPVHLNLPFREPLLGRGGELPAARADGAWARQAELSTLPMAVDLDALAQVVDRQRGVIIAGRGAGRGVAALAEAAGWPVLADPRSGARLPAAWCVAAADALLRHEEFAADHAPEVVVHLGEPVASKVVNQWVAACGALSVRIGREGPTDPDHRTALRVVGDPTAVAAGLAARVRGASGTPWLARWRHAEDRAQRAIAQVIASHAALSEPGVARALAGALPDDSYLVASSSMPIRDLEWYGAPREGLTVLSNRGANGIDGVVATATGVALATGRPTAALLGDVALVHDASSLTALARRPADLLVAVVDNDGGGIFSFLPQASALSSERFEQLFGTPHGTDLVALARAHGIDASTITTATELAAAARSIDGVRLVRIATERAANVTVHDDLHRAVATALRSGSTR